MGALLGIDSVRSLSPSVPEATVILRSASLVFRKLDVFLCRTFTLKAKMLHHVQPHNQCLSLSGNKLRV